ncbi:hypothetical protein EAS68_00505 [Legionella jordanis]|uniref:hypothetical protein n=1 Tax=Legionella jordanis TaxID=456 RepID=UPI000EFFD891|nr:hypothetical protein [Legionella jordanis]RMX22045.1 hypothetical protein EAS68_00505 [Legionella jordanis]
MTDFFDRVKQGLKRFSTSGSTSCHRKTERSNAVTEIVGQSLGNINPTAVIPTKLAQGLISGYGFFAKDTGGKEKIIHCMQASLSFSYLGVAIALFFQSGECEDLSDNLCKSLFLLDLLYKGTLLVGWIPSEFLKASPEEPQDNPVPV